MDELQREIDEYRDQHWDEVVADIEALVSIESVEDLEAAAEGAPYGPGPRKALDQALAIAERMGLDAHDCEGHVGYADFAGSSTSPSDQVGIIGHVDVVPAGPGWSFEPYAVTRREGYLLGRGVIDDKGPLMVALHAVKFWKDRCERNGQVLPRTIRVLFGANEETNMKDVEYYRAHYEDPGFLFTPDSQFPVGYGESGICSGTLTSAPVAEGAILEMHGGQAVNAVPGQAWAIVRADALTGANDADNAEGHTAQESGSAAITLEHLGNGMVRVQAHGTSAHASTPELGRNAIGLLVDYLLDACACTPQERSFLQLAQRLHAYFDGSGLGVACRDEHFGPLTAVGGVVNLDAPSANGSGLGVACRGEHLGPLTAVGGVVNLDASSADGGEGEAPERRITQSIDFRYPTTTTSADIEQAVAQLAAEAGATFVMEHDKTPFLMNPDSDDVRALLDAYCLVTGEDAKGLTSKGGTYARCFTTGVSFGLEKPWEDNPDWVGGMHGPDEGVSENLLKQAFSIYARAIANLMGIKE